MKHTCDRAGIHQAMQTLPLLSANAANPTRSGGHGQGDHEDETSEADSNIGALGNIAPNLVKVEKLIDGQVSGEVQEAVKEGEESDHAAEADEPVLARDTTERGNGERREDENQRPIAGRVGDDLDGIGSEAIVKTLPGKMGEGDEGGEEDGEFEKAKHEHIAEFRLQIAEVSSLGS